MKRSARSCPAVKRHGPNDPADAPVIPVPQLPGSPTLDEFLAACAREIEISGWAGLSEAHVKVVASRVRTANTFERALGAFLPRSSS